MLTGHFSDEIVGRYFAGLFLIGQLEGSKEIVAPMMRQFTVVIIQNTHHAKPGGEGTHHPTLAEERGKSGASWT